MAVKDTRWKHPSELTEADRTKLAQVQAKWTLIAENTAPTNRDLAQQALKGIYPGLAERKIKWITGSFLPEDVASLSWLANSAKFNLERQVIKQVGRYMWSGLMLHEPVSESRREGIERIGIPLAQIRTSLVHRFWGLQQQLLTTLTAGRRPTWGQLDISSFALVDCYRQLGMEGLEGLDHAQTLLQNIFGVWITKDTVYLAEHPTQMHFDDRGLAHNTNRPSVVWRDGTEAYFLEGARVNEIVVTSPRDIPISLILSENNLTVRQILIEHMGREKFLSLSGARKISQSPRGILWQVLLTTGEPIHMVEVENATPAQDGSRDHHFVGIPPAITDVDEAVAWTFGMTPQEYSPSLES